MNDFDRQQLGDALDGICRAADRRQGILNQLSRESIPAGGAGRLLSLGREIDDLERCATTLAELLDQPRGMGRGEPGQTRGVPWSAAIPSELLDQPRGMGGPQLPGFLSDPSRCDDPQP